VRHDWGVETPKPDTDSPGPVLNERGEVERPAGPADASSTPQLLPEVTLPTQAPPPLELAYPTRPAEAPPPPVFAPPPPVQSPRTRSRWPFVLLALVVVAACGLFFGGALVVQELRQLAQQRLSEALTASRQQGPSVLEQLPKLGETPPVVITSEPDGATIRVGGEVVGVTPWAGDNVWSGEQPVVLELRGYRPWQSSLQGGREVRLSARLTR
jgi:hypothetical protein